MKKKWIFFSLFILQVSFIEAQSTDYKVVFDLSSRDSINQQSIIRELGLIMDSNPEAKLEVVIYGQGLDLALKDRSTAPVIQKLIAENKASFKVCAMTMKRNHIDQIQLVPGVAVVPDGIFEIISKQRDGWGYIKVGH
jgi:intracellular sulfur oxidation DsrE/DsrF family protein